MGKVALEGMEFYAQHGFYAEEQVIGNRYSVDLELELDFKKAAQDDDLEGTVDYEKVYQIVAKVMSVKTKLLEHLAGKIISELKTEFPQIASAEVKVSKYNPPINGACARAVVTLKG